MTEIHLFGSIDAVPADLSLADKGVIHLPISGDKLHAYFHGTELKHVNVAIVYSGEDREREAGQIFDFMENSDAVVEPFDDPARALRYFHGWRPELMIVSAELPDLHGFLKAYREMLK